MGDIAYLSEVRTECGLRFPQIEIREELIPMRKNIWVLSVLLSGVTLAGAITVRVWVFGSGSGSELDRNSAMSEAVDQATQQANAICTGAVVNTETTASFCTTYNNDDGTTQYNCTAMVKSLCEIQGRGR